MSSLSLRLIAIFMDNKEKLINIALKQIEAGVKYRKQRLVNIQKAEDLYLNKVTKQLKNRFNMPVNTKKEAPSIFNPNPNKNPIFSLPSNASLQKWLSNNRSRLDEIASFFPNVQSQSYTQLRSHILKYPDLRDWKNLIDKWSNGLTTDYRISRLVNIPDDHENKQLHEVDLYIAGKPD